MRHLVGIVLAVALAAAVFFAASWGDLKLLIAPSALGSLPGGGGSLLHNHAVLEGFGALLGVGLVAGLLIAAPRISPLAAGLPGLALLAWSGLYLFSVRHAVQYVPLKSHAYGRGFEAMLFDGVLALAGLAMIIPLFVRGQHGLLPRPAGHPEHDRRQRPAVRLDPDRAAAAGRPGQPGRPELPAGALGPGRIQLTLRALPGAMRQAAWNCSVSVEPDRATVSAWGEMAEVTLSK